MSLKKIFVGDISSGARQDIEHATAIARSMVCEWGMSDKLGAVAYDERADSGQYLGMQGYHTKNYSETTAQAIDEEVRRILDSALEEARKIIRERHDQVELMAQMLMEFETLDAEDVRKILHNEWNIEEKRERMKKAEELHKKAAAVPPPPPPQDEGHGVSKQASDRPSFASGMPG